jgi:streptogramin lyase
MSGRIVRYDPNNATWQAYERSPEFKARRKAIKVFRRGR